jgi:hypothetical protein
MGLVSVNSPLTVKAQNSALSQDENGESEQETKQGQSSSQDNQVVSGDSSVLSGNNVLCQSQDNSEVGQSLCPSGEEIIQPPTQNTGKLRITVTLTTDPQCGNRLVVCPDPLGGGGVISFKDRSMQDFIVRSNGDYTFDVPLGEYRVDISYLVYGSVLRDWEPTTQFQGDCKEIPPLAAYVDSCRGSMTEKGGQVNVNVHLTVRP